MTLRSRLLAPLIGGLLGALVVGPLTPTPVAAATGSATGSTAGRPSDVQQRPHRGKQEPSAIFPRSSYLCYGYKDCRQSGMGNAGYAANNDTMYWRMYSGHNCTNYAAYRMVRSGLPNERPWSGSGNAMYWGTSMPKITDGTPRVGAVAWWRANTGPAGSVGHVAYVERVVSSDEVVVSQDSWGGDFSWAVITRSSGNWPSGFIHFNDRALTNTAPPQVTGEAKVGSVLTSTTGSWKPGGPTIAYQWYADGQPISGADSQTLKLSRARVDQKITVTATASSPGLGSARATSAPTAAVLPGVLRNTSAPQIAGEPKVGHSLSLDLGTWNPQPQRLAVQWLADGRPLTDRAGSTLDVTPNLVDRTITARVTASRSGYDPVTASSAPTSSVAPGTITTTDRPAISGTLALDGTLTIDPGRYTPSTAHTAVQWLRDGTPVPGATGETYTLGAADLGARISARVSVSNAGYVTEELDAPATDVLRSEPRLAVQTVSRRHRLPVFVTVTAPGVREVTGTVVVRFGRTVEHLTLRHGHGRVLLRDLPPRTRTLQVRYQGSDTVKRAYTGRTVTIH